MRQIGYRSRQGSIPGMLIGGVLVLGIWPHAVPAHAQALPPVVVPLQSPKVCPPPPPPMYVYSAYSIKPPGGANPQVPVVIQYKATRNATTRLITLEKATPSPASLDILFHDGIGVPPDAILVTFNVKYCGREGWYTLTKDDSPIKLNGDHYTVDLKGFAASFIADLDAMPPCHCGHCERCNWCDHLHVEVWVTPVLPSDPVPAAKVKKGIKTPVIPPLIFGVQQVLGDLGS